MKKWKKIETEIEQNYPFFQVRKDIVLSPGGQEREYSWIVMHRPFVTILPVDQQKRVWLVKQHRYPLGRFSIELPGGVVDMHETPIDAAERELEEEIGARSQKWTNLGKVKEMGVTALAPGIIFVASDVETVPNPRKDPLDKEMFEILKLTKGEVKNLISSNEIFDTCTLAAFYKASLKELW